MGAALYLKIPLPNITDGELADLISMLQVELNKRQNRIIRNRESGAVINSVLDANSLTVRSWTSEHRKLMKAQL